MSQIQLPVPLSAHFSCSCSETVSLSHFLCPSPICQKLQNWLKKTNLFLLLLEAQCLILFCLNIENWTKRKFTEGAGVFFPSKDGS